MKKFSAADIANGYFEHHIAFKDLDVEEEDGNFLTIEHVSSNPTPLSKQELIDDYDISSEVADKLIGYQADLLESYRNSVIEFLGQVDRYMEIKPHLNNQTLNKAMLTQYVTNDWDWSRMLKEFHPIKHLRSGIIGVSLSCSIFLLAVSFGWNAHPPTGFDFISLGIVAFIWLGFTAAVAWQLPSEYRTRKVVYRILSTHSEGGDKAIN